MIKEDVILISGNNPEEAYYSMDGKKTNRNYKDTLFRFIFSDKKKLLYNVPYKVDTTRERDCLKC